MRPKALYLKKNEKTKKQKVQKEVLSPHCKHTECTVLAHCKHTEYTVPNYCSDIATFHIKKKMKLGEKWSCLAVGVE